MNTKELEAGDLTNKGIIHWIDNPTPNIEDRLVKTSQGIVRYSELEFIEKSKKPAPRDLKASVDFNAVMGIDIRPGKVISAARVKDTEKLIEMRVSTALGKKTVVTNLGSDFEPEDFVEKTFMFVMNMPPMKMRGILSEAMIMASSVFRLDEKTNEWVEKFILMPINIPMDSIVL
jgi:methionyl-tRNA synthetase